MPLTLASGIINLAVEDLQRSLDFYVGKLGFSVVDRTTDDWTLLQAGDLQIALVPAGQPVHPRAASLLFVVPNINRALRELTRAGIEITEFFPEHDLAQFRDPDGHRLGVVQERSGQPAEPEAPVDGNA